MLQYLKVLRYIIKLEQCSDLKAVRKFLQLALYRPWLQMLWRNNLCILAACTRTKSSTIIKLALSHIVSRIMTNNIQLWKAKADLKTPSFYFRFQNSTGKNNFMRPMTETLSPRMPSTLDACSLTRFTANFHPWVYEG